MYTAVVILALAVRPAAEPSWPSHLYEATVMTKQSVLILEFCVLLSYLHIVKLLKFVAYAARGGTMMAGHA